MSRLAIAVFVVCLSVAFAAPFSSSNNNNNDVVSQMTMISNEDMAWEREIGDEVNKVMMPRAMIAANNNNRANQQVNDMLQTNVQTSWTAAKATDDQHPAMDSTISNLRGVLDRLEMENVNDVAVQEAQTSSYASKRAQIQSMLALPQQAIAQRLQERQLCEKRAKSLQELTVTLASSIERTQQLVRVRQEQATHYSQTTTATKEITAKNKVTLAKIQQLLSGEIATEQSLNGGGGFDQVALRTQQPEDVLHTVQNLGSNLAALMGSKVSHGDVAVSNITATFGCPMCEKTADELKAISQRVSGELDDATKECARLTAAHREMDEADREKAISLKKDLEDLEEAERVHKAAAGVLQLQRANSQAVAKKMIGFFDSVASRT
eukprot:c11770_g4_i2.p1 GENE.c11770_g4_i2~~c11770_g4_i2.p1  ORF type:complete len:393 (-),score=148.47 c11770_g4_i2:106-1245(-)